MRLHATLILFASLAWGSAAEASYRIQFVQTNEPPGVHDSGSWTCGDADMKNAACMQGIIVTVAGQPTPIEVRLGDQGGLLWVQMAAGAWLLGIRSSRRLIFDRDGIIESSMTLWETDQPLTNGLLHDLVLRPPGTRALATLIFAVKRVPDRP